MKILLIGSGGREHAIAWILQESPRLEQLYVAPGNAGMEIGAKAVDIAADDIKGLLDFAKSNAIDLTIVRPEAPLVAGIVDEFQKEGLRIFGPSEAAAQLEGSKVFSKEAMKRFGVPTADFKVFDNPEDAKTHTPNIQYPVVIKADGLAAGKGVIIAKNKEEAVDAIKLIMEDKKFGAAGDKIIIEDCLVGEEASIIVVSDGEHVIPMASSQDHKAIYDGDEGPNTGGMGAYSPAPVVTEAIQKECMEKVVYPMIKGMASEGNKFVGVLYAGIMVTKEGPKVLEFNVRFGDPETQAILPRLKSDLVDIIEATIDGKLNEISIEWNPKACVCVVLASGGYPGEYEKGKEIQGLAKAAMMHEVFLFHAGTKRYRVGDQRLNVITSGGRVLGVSALGEDIKAAIDRAYQAVERVSFNGMYYRKDIGAKALRREKA